ncbi:MAG: GNAT family N-acetyltransferase [Verrucomicrobia bacterium]|nr:GNAT family N-acetyltransferase [Verrucomicrobiota bacterium]
MADPCPSYRIRAARPDDRPATYRVCLETGDAGRDGTSLFQDDPEALGRFYVGPYLQFEPRLALVLEDDTGVCGYALAVLDSRPFYRRFEEEWLTELRRQFPEPSGDPTTWTPARKMHWEYHHPSIHLPKPYAHYPSHLHIDLMPRAQGHRLGVRMMDILLGELRRLGSPGVHLAMHPGNHRALHFYGKLGFTELIRTGAGDSATLYLGLRFAA